MNCWALYHNTRDFPGLYVGRRFILDNPTPEHFAHTSIEQVRAWVRKNAASHGQGLLTRLKRDPADDPCIVEAWI
jgi:hypothetical protein